MARIRVLPRSQFIDIAKKPTKPIDWTKWFIIVAFLAPGFITLIYFLLLPVTESVSKSQYSWNGLGEFEDTAEYVEWDNYQRLEEDKHFRTALENTALLVVLSLVVQLPLAMILAIMVGHNKFPGRGLFRLVFFVPYVFSEVITALIWRYVYHPQSGLVNVVAETIIPDFERIGWLSEKNIVMFSVFSVLTWKYFGIHMILYMAALQNVPKELEEAARIDGANELTVLRRIVLPLISPTIRLTIYLSVLGSLQQFVLVWVLTRGDPVDSSHVLGTYIFKFGFAFQRLGFGSAASVVVFLIMLAFSLSYQTLFMRRDYTDATT